ncbi:MAG: hypothetical protein KDD64_09140 [Bdellovibrionales bacterium]|nr:hypothetical protein [Bdellovibrionales bacterium]
MLEQEESPKIVELLDASRVLETIQLLEKRIGERFPKSGLARVCSHLVAVAERLNVRVMWIRRPLLWLRLAVAIFIVGTLLLLLYTSFNLRLSHDGLSLFDFVQVLEAAINDVVLVGAALFFLLTVEMRYKRARIARSLSELRSIAHIIDMHQLTKDPEKLVFPQVYTPSSPKIELTPYLLSRYLDYCSEMLALVGKLAALYAQAIDDHQSTAAAAEIEDLTSGLSRKIWQKIMILHAAESSSQSNTLVEV